MPHDQQQNTQWDYEYLPYTIFGPEERELPNYRIYPPDAPEAYVAETNEDLPGDVQFQHALLIAAAPELLKAAMLAAILCELVTLWCDSDGRDSDDLMTDIVSLVQDNKQPREAISKASGGRP